MADHDAVDPVIAFVALYRVAVSLPVLRWPFWGGVLAVVGDLFDLLLFDLFATHGGWPWTIDYQAFDKWADQVYLAAFLFVAWRDFGPLPRRIAVALYVLRLAGFVTFEAGLLTRGGLVLFPNVFELWFLAVAFTLRYRPTFAWTAGRSAAVLTGLTVVKLAQEWALHVARLFDATTFLGALEAIWRALTGASGASGG